MRRRRRRRRSARGGGPDGEGRESQDRGAGAASSRAGAVSVTFEEIGVMDGDGGEGRGVVGRSPPPKLPFCVCWEHNDKNKKKQDYILIYLLLMIDNSVR